MFKNIITKEVHLSGVGLHTGQYVNLKICAGLEGEGLKFIRTDLDNDVVINADITMVVSTDRCTKLATSDGVSVSTVEHILAALYSKSIEDARIYIDGPEVPIFDGSAQIYIDNFDEKNIEQVESKKEVFSIQESFTYVDEMSGAEYIVLPSDCLEINTIVLFPSETHCMMAGLMKGKEEFSKNIANSRTYALLSDLEKLRDQGLIKGGSLENAVVILDKPLTETEMDDIKKKWNINDIVISSDDTINPDGFRYKNEPARHKILDLLGDLSLIGRDINAKIIATKPGHTGNIALAKLIKAKYLEFKKNPGRPIYDVNKEPVMSLEQIKSYLPHRYPFLMVDKVIEISPTHIVGVKNITSNEEFFEGHFPGNPIFPGVLQMEALAQTGGILALTTVEEKGSWDTYFLKMDNVKFKAKVIPGDTLILKMELLAPIRRGIVQMMGTAYVGNKLVSEGELTAQILKRQND